MSAQWLQGTTALGGALVLTATEVVADTAAKVGNQAAITYGGYMVLAYELQEVFKHNGIGLTNAYWNALTNVTHTLIGRQIFGEVLSTQQYVGIGLVTAGIFLMGMGDSHGNG
jgi:multidrug transporter EmrE-like cation transporter